MTDTRQETPPQGGQEPQLAGAPPGGGRVTVRGVAHDDASAELLPPCELPPGIIEQPDIWLPDAKERGGFRRYSVTERKVLVTEGRATVELRLKEHRESMMDRTLSFLSDLPGDWTVYLAATAASVTAVGSLALILFVALNPFAVLGFMANHADLAAAVSVAVFLAYLASRQKHDVVVTFLIILWFTATGSVWVLFWYLWPDVVRPEAAAGGYEALGVRVHASRGEWIAAVAPYVPTALVLLKALGLDTAAALIEKNLPRK